MMVSRVGLNLSETGLLFLFSLPVSPSAFSYSLLPSFKPALLLIFLAHGLQDLSAPNEGIESETSPLKAWTPNRWTMREYPKPTLI